MTTDAPAASAGRFGEFGGQYIPETLMPACAELEEAWTAAQTDEDFQDELERNPLDLAEQGFNQVASVIRRDKAAALLRELGAEPTPAPEDQDGLAASR